MVSRFLRFPGGKSRALTLSYDDGVIQDLRFVEIMKKYGLKGTFNINAGLFSPEDKVFPEGQIHRRMKASEIANAYPEAFCEVACHGYTHPWLEQCDPANATAEVLEDRRSLEAMFDRPIQGMAYPYGTFSDQVVEILRNCGIRYSRTTVSTEKFTIPTDWLRLPATCHHNNPRLMELADQFLAESRYPQARLFYLWGHTYEFDTNNNWQVIEDFAAKISGHEDIWYATNMEIYDACQDFNRLESTADGHIVRNPNARDVWFADRNNRVYQVGPGETIRL
jgi:peptidoglycan/xylan/chitin deacetylase (PgdA/CDA1 family)